MKTVSSQIRTRLYATLVMMLVLPALVTLQALRITVFEGEQLRDVARKQWESLQTIPAFRGSIMDRKGRLLVVNTARYELALDPSMEGFKPRAQAFYTSLSRLTGKPASGYGRAVRNRKSLRYVLLERSITEQQKNKVEEWGIPGVVLTPKFARRYNYGRVGGHVLGYVGIDMKGLAGVEQAYDDHLTGTDGRRVLIRDRRGAVRAPVGGLVVDPQHGGHIVLTIDLVRQAIAEEELKRGVEETRARWGTVIAMDPRTGEILAMANAPSFDPNDAPRYSEAARRNHAIVDRIEPGSTFKLVTAVAALEAGGVRTDTPIDTGPGVATFSGRMMRDTRAHGTISFAQVLIESSNIGAARAGLRVKPADFYRYARSFGFGQPTWIDLPGEVEGSLKKPDRWSKLTQAWMSHGYEVEVTPLQLLTAYAALANGGLLVQPYVVAERRTVYGETVWAAKPDSIRRIFEPETARALRPVFQAVVDSGTAKQARVKNLAVAGKTGTAKKAPYDQPLYRATFVGFFPADDPLVAMVVVLDEPKTSGYGGIAAAPVFGRIAERWVATLPAVAERMAKPDSLPKTAPAVVPDLRQVPVRVAEARLASMGLPVRREHEVRPFATVSASYPDRGESVTGPVRLAVNDPVVPVPDLMPDLRGLSARDAAAWLSARGIPFRLVGSGAVTGQKPEPGTPAPRSAVLTCR